MSISRRIFIKVGTAAAVVAGVSLKPSISAVAQDVADKVGMSTQSDPLSFYTQSSFLQYVNSVFRLHGLITVDVTLERVEDTLPANASKVGGRESFVLYFRGGSTALPQDTYTIEHPALGTFKLFLVPGRPDSNGVQGYAATINRLAYMNKQVGPRKPTGTKSTGNKSTGAQTREETPTSPPVEAPAEPQPAAPQRRPIRKIGPGKDNYFDID